jgi:hypothetical protein
MRYFLDLGFWPRRVELGQSLVGARGRWTLASYGLLTLGLFARQWTAFPAVRLDLANFNVSVFLASVVIATAIFPPFMVWFNRKVEEPGWPQVLWAFSFGFFVDLVRWKFIQ